ncbi:substrate-binding domain-containing protein [Actinoplanes sp. NPDC049316]|uniref:substrate-binding domain-containing protein n=1 Tax=Actinoplanes sp. NPDC049316 TaxID=3154727 RepID=UPI003443729A
MKRCVAAATALVLVTAGCTYPGAGAKKEAPGVSRVAETRLLQLKGQVLSDGPHGEKPAPASAADLTPNEIAQVKAKHATAAIVMHYAGNDWAIAQIAGLKHEFTNLGIRVLAVTDANFKPDQQVSNLETVLSQKPDIIVSIPTDPVATADAYKRAAATGARLVFMDNVPNGMAPGRDYVSMVSADNYGNGVVSAHLLAKSLGGEGEIGVIYHEADFFVTKQRWQGFTATIKQDYPGIRIVEEKGIAGPDFAGDAQNVANAYLSRHPKLDGIWAVWDVPAEGVMAAARSYGRYDLAVATEDLGRNVAIALAKNQIVVGLGAQMPFDQGVTEARLGAGALLGKSEPPYVALSALPVDHTNVLEAWKQVYHSDPPEYLRDSYQR